MDIACGVTSVPGGRLGAFRRGGPPRPPCCSRTKGRLNRGQVPDLRFPSRPRTQPPRGRVPGSPGRAAPGCGDPGGRLSPTSRSYGDPKQWAAFLGTPFLSGAEGQLERVARIHKHPFYNLYTLDYDVALLELAGPVRRSRLVRPICLPEPAPRPPDGARCVITGWGSVREGGRRGWDPRPPEG